MLFEAIQETHAKEKRIKFSYEHRGCWKCLFSLCIHFIEEWRDKKIIYFLQKFILNEKLHQCLYIRDCLLFFFWISKMIPNPTCVCVCVDIFIWLTFSTSHHAWAISEQDRGICGAVFFLRCRFRWEQKSDRKTKWPHGPLLKYSHASVASKWTWILLLLLI